MNGILSGEQIKQLRDKDISEAESLVVAPLLEDDQIGSDAIDLRLGTYFVVYRRTTIPLIRFGPGEKPKSISEFQSRVHIPLGCELIIPPSTFVLGSTLEYIKLPYNVCGRVGTRSSWGRLGLVIATAVNVHACFRGCLTLELVNHGEIPIAITPGIKIGQLTLHNVLEPIHIENELKGKYIGSIRPEFSKLSEEDETICKLRKVSRKYHAELGES